HDVEVVHVVPGGGGAGPVPAVRDQHGAAAAHLGEHGDGLVVGAGGGLVGPEAGPAAGSVLDLVVVDLLELRLTMLAVVDRLVVLVRGVAGPVAAGGDDLAGDERVHLVEGAAGAEVAHHAGHVPAAADLDGDVLGADQRDRVGAGRHRGGEGEAAAARRGDRQLRSEEHTSELQSRFDLVCRLLLEKKN